MADADSVIKHEQGVDQAGYGQDWRYVKSRHNREFGEIVDDPDKGPWNRQNPDGRWQEGHTDMAEQIVCVGEQTSWVHTFSDGRERDMGDVLLELMEFAIQWRTAQGLPASAFDTSGRPGRP